MFSTFLVSLFLLLLQCTECYEGELSRRHKQDLIELDKVENILVYGGSKVWYGSLDKHGFLGIFRQEMASNNIVVTFDGRQNSSINNYLTDFENKVIKTRPSLTILMFGDDDVLQQGTHIQWNMNQLKHAFVRDLEYFIVRSLEHKIPVVLSTTTIYGDKADYTNYFDIYLETLNGAIDSLSKKYKLPLIDYRFPLLKYLERANHENALVGQLTLDGQFFNHRGHMLMASILLSKFTYHGVKFRPKHLETQQLDEALKASSVARQKHAKFRERAKRLKAQQEMEVKNEF